MFRKHEDGCRHWCVDLIKDILKLKGTQCGCVDRNNLAQDKAKGWLFVLNILVP